MTAPSASTAARREEQRCASDFFRLLFITDKRQLFAPHAIGTVDWKLTSHCLDTLNYRYADTFFCAALALRVVVCKSYGAALWQHRLRALYTGLVAYNFALLKSPVCPAMTYWNSLVTLDCDIGNIARSLRSPEFFNEVALRGPAGEAVSGSTRSSAERDQAGNDASSAWLKQQRLLGYLDTVSDIVLLRTLFSHIFAGSCWRRVTGDGQNRSEETTLVLCNRFLRWQPFQLLVTRDKGVRVSIINIRYLPTVRVSKNLQRSYLCRDIILNRTSFGASMWYRVHFGIINLLGVR